MLQVGSPTKPLPATTKNLSCCRRSRDVQLRSWTGAIPGCSRPLVAEKEGGHGAIARSSLPRSIHEHVFARGVDHFDIRRSTWSMCNVKSIICPSTQPDVHQALRINTNFVPSKYLCSYQCSFVYHFSFPSLVSK